MRIIALPRRFVRQEWGGTETVVLETGKELRRCGHDLSIYTSSIFSDVKQEIMDGVPIRRFPYSYPVWGLKETGRDQLDKKGGNLFSLPLMRALRSEPNLDLIHLHTLKRMGGIGRREALRRGIPYIASLHGGVLDVPTSEQEDLVSPLKNTVEWGKFLGWWVGSNRVLEDAAAILCVGQTEQEKIQQRYPNKRVHFLPNGVDCRRFAKGDGPAFRDRYGISPSAELILVVGRMDGQKNQLAAIRGLSVIRQKCPDAHLLLIGHVTSPSYLQKMRKEITDCKLQEHITVLEGLAPAGSDLVDAYHAADVFLLPSVHEPFGIVVLEAWAAGLPVVASRVGGIPSFVQEEQNGLLFDPGNEPVMAEQVVQVLKQPQLKASLAEAGQRQALDRFDWSHITQQLLDIYSEVRGENSLCA